ncbi:MAG TPA: hypothetical protein PK275_03440 [Chitinophagaceae bacterium]|nr:hypothetical protein [Chitinophagaceae bacterium]
MHITYHHQEISTNVQHIGLWSRFIKWCESQEQNRFGWIAGILVGHGCVATILTMLAIQMNGNHFIFWPFAIAAMGACVITNLAAMPTKVTIPVFAVSLLIDLAIIAICIIGVVIS